MIGIIKFKITISLGTQGFGWLPTPLIWNQISVALGYQPWTRFPFLSHSHDLLEDSSMLFNLDSMFRGMLSNTNRKKMNKDGGKF